jgi:hypothetical protein
MRRLFFLAIGSQVVKLLSYRTLHGNQLAADKLDKELPEDNPLPDKAFHRCAVVGNSGSLLEDQRGAEIDEHDAVLRFNAAKIAGFEQFVGSKTTIRLLNSPDASWPKDGTEATIMTIRNHEAVSSLSHLFMQAKEGEGKKRGGCVCVCISCSLVCICVYVFYSLYWGRGLLSVHLYYFSMKGMA